MKRLSTDKTRAIDDMPPLGIAAYKGAIKGDEWVGQHVGIFHRIEDALSWLDDGTPAPTPIFKSDEV